MELLEYLDNSEGTDELYEMLRSRPAQEIEDLCMTFPIESLSLDYDSTTRDFRNNKRFEIITILAQILVRYDEILEKNPELHLPNSLPASKLANILMSRLIPHISNQQNVDVSHNLRIRLYEFAHELIKSGSKAAADSEFSKRNQEALTCLLVSQPSIKEDHDFWIFACRYNIAITTKKPEDINTAISAGEDIISGRVKVPENNLQGARKILSDLNKMK